ncbi:MAG: NAD-dependent epimerase/dehydratase family protein [Pirellulales bacterium]
MHQRLVVGCGYLGERVARRWVAAGDRVLATTRRETRADELASFGAAPVIIDVTANDPGWRGLFDTAGLPRTVFWGVGFDRAGGGTHRDVHVDGLRRLLDALAAARGAGSPPRVILSSSTGVWGDVQGEVVDESTPTNPARDAGRVLLEAEALLAAHPAGPGTSLRFAGLYGPGRLPRLDDLRAGLPIAADPESWLNLIHVDDAAAVVTAVADAAAPGRLYVVSDGHPVRRREWYERLAEASGSTPPRWDPAAPRARGADKRVDSARVYRDLGIRPHHPDPLAAAASIVASE